MPRLSSTLSAEMEDDSQKASRRGHGGLALGSHGPHLHLRLPPVEGCATLAATVYKTLVLPPIRSGARDNARRPERVSRPEKVEPTKQIWRRLTSPGAASVMSSET